MEEQKVLQRKWYDRAFPPGEKRIIQVSIDTHIKRLKDFIPVQRVPISLNCGCGRGEQSDIFGRSIGMDISLENIRLLKEAGKQGIVADVEFLPFRDDTFDLVYGFGILHHMNDMKKGIAEAVKVLKIGGYIGFGGENNGLCPLNYIMPFIYGNWIIEKGFYRIRLGRLKKIFQELGIKEVQCSTRGMTIYGMGKSIYQLTSWMERILSDLPFIKPFSGYCYLAGRKTGGKRG